MRMGREGYTCGRKALVCGGTWRKERISWRKGREKLRKRVVREEEGGTHGGKDRLGGRGAEVRG